MANSKSIPKPPERRPTVAERISMLQMAQTQHGTFCPMGGVKLVLPRLPKNAANTEVVDAADEFLEPVVATKPQRRPRYFPWKRSSASSNRKPEVITVRLLDESEW
jgi:hypothetical protein